MMKTTVKHVLMGCKRKYNSLLDKVNFISVSKLRQELEKMPDYPNSASKRNQILDLSIRGTAETLIDLNKILETVPLTIIDIDEMFEDKSINVDFERKIGERFRHYGSDKSTIHNYHRVYSRIFALLGAPPKNILEIGLGSNDPDVPSNMGRRAKPGASIRAWSDLFPECKIIGADIDEKILFREGNISTFKLDQTSRISWESFQKSLFGIEFDLVIDDGLHSPSANLKSLIYGLELLTKSGFLVIEDIHPRSLPVWTIALKSLGQSKKYWFLRTSNGLCLVVRNTNV